MFRQSADRFASMVASMKQMAAEMHQELESTRNELRRGVLEMPQEAAESSAQMRKVIVDQIEALAELNRIVAHHGRGLDVVTGSRSAQQEDESILAAADGRGEPRPAQRAAAAHQTCRRPISACPPRDALTPRRSPPRAPTRGATAGFPICSAAPITAQPARQLAATIAMSRAPVRPSRPTAATRWRRCRSTSAA